MSDVKFNLALDCIGSDTHNVESCCLLISNNGSEKVIAGDFDYKKVVDALFGGCIPDFIRVYLNSRGEYCSVRVVDVVGEGIAYILGQKLTAIPSNILTPETVGKLKELLVNASTNADALEIAEAINKLLKERYTQKNFAALIGKDMTADKLIAMSEKVNEINEVLEKAGDASEDVARVISRLDSKNIGGALKDIGELLKDHTNIKKNFTALIGDASIEKIAAMSEKAEIIEKILEKAKNKSLLTNYCH